MRLLRARLSFVAVLLLLAIVFPEYAAAQSATPATDSPPTGVLAEFDIAELPSPHAEVWFLRMELAPGGAFPGSGQPGQMVIVVEKGELVIEADGPIVRGSPDPAPADAMSPRRIAANGSVMVEPGIGFALRNETEAPTRFLMLLTFSAMDEVQGSENDPQPTGLTQTGVAVGTAEFYPGPAIIRIERITCTPGESLPSAAPAPMVDGPGWMGFEGGTVETGTADVTFSQTSYQNMILPPMSPTTPWEPKMISLAADEQIATGQGYSAFNTHLTWHATGDEPLTVMRVVITPMGGGQ